jgi:hypothetical protein
MKGGLGLVLAVVLLLGLASQSQAQMPAGDFGGFGYNYAQTVPSNSYILDRWWMVTESPTVETTPPTVSTAQTQEGLVAQPAATARRVGGRRLFNRARAPRTYSLPTGSLYWPGAGAVSLYSPAQRHQSYDAGYARSPYGSINYGIAYKGYDWGY